MVVSKIVRQRRSGQVTIPIGFRRELGLEEDSVLKFTLDGSRMYIDPLTTANQDDNRGWLRELYEYFAPARAEAIEKGYTDEEINAWIDEAVREVRAERG